MPEAVHAVAAYRHATPLGVRVALRRIAKPHAVAAIVRRRDAPAARWRGNASTARWRGAIHPRSEAARGNCQRQSSAAYDFNQFFQGFLTISSNNYQVRPGHQARHKLRLAVVHKGLRNLCADKIRCPITSRASGRFHRLSLP